MSYFRIRACKKGHYQIDYRRVKKGDSCPECGGEVFDQCPECGQFIRQWIYYGASMIGPKKEDVELPEACSRCGRPFPWSGE